MEEEKTKQAEEIHKENESKTNIIGLGDLISAAFSNFWKRFATFIRLELFRLLVALAILAVFGILIAIIIFISSAGESTSGGLSTTAMVIVAVIGGLLAVSAIVFGVWSEAAYAEISTFSGEKIGVIESYKRTWSKTSAYFWTIFAKEMVIIAGYVLFVIPGIIFSVWFSFTEFIVIREEAGGTNALLLSKKYVGGKWWSVFWRLLVLLLILVGVLTGFGIIEQVIVNIGSLFVVLVGGVASSEILIVVGGIILIVLAVILRLASSIFVKAWALIYRSHLYDNFKNVKGDLRGSKLGSSWWLYPFILITLLFYGLIMYWATMPIYYGQDISSIISNATDYDSYGSIVETVEDSNMRAKDNSLQATALNLSTALETYYTINGYYPFTESIDDLWEGENAVLDVEPSLPLDCGTINNPGYDCGLEYNWQNKDSYTININYILDGSEVIEGGENSMSDQTILEEDEMTNN